MPAQLPDGGISQIPIRLCHWHLMEMNRAAEAGTKHRQVRARAHVIGESPNVKFSPEQSYT